MNFSDAFLGESSTLQTNFIHAVGVGLAGRGGHGEWQHVLGDGGASADIGVRADSHELVHGAEGSDYGPLFDGYVTANSGPIHQHDVIANHAIVSHMRVGHDKQMATDFGEATTFHGSAIEGDVFANLVVIADFQAGGLAAVRDILGRHADRGVREKRLVAADHRRAVDHDMRQQTAGFSEFDIRADDAIGADLAGSWYLRARIDDGCGMNHRGWVAALTGGIHGQDPLSFDPRPRELSMSWQDTIASATFLSPTKA